VTTATKSHTFSSTAVKFPSPILSWQLVWLVRPLHQIRFLVGS